VSASGTTFTNNSAVSGGAVYVSGPTNGVAVGRFDCAKCTLKDNRAVSQVGVISMETACCLCGFYCCKAMFYCCRGGSMVCCYGCEQAVCILSMQAPAFSGIPQA
jgi:predicted outer membrane repeat protein